MSKFDYQALRRTAEELINKFGFEAQLIVRTKTGGTDQAPTYSEQEHPVTVVLQRYRKDEIDGTRIKSTDKKILVSTEGLTVSLDTAHSIKLLGKKHAVVKPEPFTPGSVDIYYILQARA